MILIFKEVRITSRFPFVKNIVELGNIKTGVTPNISDGCFKIIQKGPIKKIGGQKDNENKYCQ